MPPARVRPETHMWICSATTGIAKDKIVTEELSDLLGWNEPLKPGLIAAQLTKLSQSYEVWFSDLPVTDIDLLDAGCRV